MPSCLGRCSHTCTQTHTRAHSTHSYVFVFHLYFFLLTQFFLLLALTFSLALASCLLTCLSIKLETQSPHPWRHPFAIRATATQSWPQPQPQHPQTAATNKRTQDCRLPLRVPCPVCVSLLARVPFLFQFFFCFRSRRLLLLLSLLSAFPISINLLINLLPTSTSTAADPSHPRPLALLSCVDCLPSCPCLWPLLVLLYARTTYFLL